MGKQAVCDFFLNSLDRTALAGNNVVSVVGEDGLEEWCGCS